MAAGPHTEPPWWVARRATPRPGPVRRGREANPGRRPALPLTERILGSLPGPRLTWVVAWALVPWVNLAVLVIAGTSGWHRTGVPLVEVLNRAAVTLAVVLSLWGVHKIADELQWLRPRLGGVVGDADVVKLFRGMGKIAGPIAIVAAVGIALPLDELARGESVAALVQAGTWLFIGVPLSTAVWVYVALQVGLVRLGRAQIRLQGYRGDRSLGLRPVGRLAFTGFWMLFGSVLPLVLTGSSDVPVALAGMSVLVAAVGLFFFSLRDLHRQMVRVRQREVDRALALYHEAYRHVQTEPTLTVLQEQAGVLGAAEALERRAERIQAWPFDEATFARVLTIVTSATATILARLLLAPTGL